MDTTNSRSTQSYRIKKDTINTSIFSDESISSWLIRAALDCGTEPLTFTGFYWNKFRLWNYDLDRGFEPIDKEIYTDITTLSINGSIRLQKHSLYAYLMDINGEATLRKGQAKWVIARGSRDRTHNIGQNYCSHCLDESPYLRNQWRLAWYFGCLKHNVLLENRCKNCGTLYQPHRLSAEKRTLNHCHHCGEKLNNQPHLLNQTQTVALNLLEKVFINGSGLCFGKEVNSESYFFALRYWINQLRRAALNPPARARAQLIKHLGIEHHTICVPKTGLAFEILPIDERINLLLNALPIMNASRNDMIQAIQHSGITQNLLSLEPYPEILESIFQHALVGRTCAREESIRSNVKSISALNRKWECIKRQLHLEP